MAVTAPPVNSAKAGSKKPSMAARRHNPLTGILHPGLPFALVPMLPVFWLLGLGYFAFAIAGTGAGLGLLLIKPIRVPKGFGAWLLFVAWMLVSVVMLDPTLSRYVAFMFRAVIYFGATALFLYVYNLPAKYLPTGRILASLALIFVFTAIVGGYAGLILGEVRFNSVVARVLPGSLLSNSLINATVRPPFAQTQDFLGFAINRPSMPYAFTNQWGATLVPTTFAAIAAAGRLQRFRRLVPLVALLAFIPMALSANRGLWIALIASVFYVAIRRASTGQLVLAIRLIVAMVFVAGLVLVSPLGEVVGGRATSSHSIDARGDIYTDVLERVPDSPLLGFGAPEANPNPNRPAIGTHGMFWTTLFSNGIPGAVMYTVFWVGMAFRTGRNIKNQEQLLLHLAVASALPTLMIYDHAPAALPIMMICAAVVLRDRRDDEAKQRMFRAPATA